MRRRARQEESEEKINLTPMLDVVFIMLIFFIVTATFVKEIGLDMNQPEDDKPKTIDPNKKSIIVKIGARDQIVVSGRSADLRTVRANIEQLHAESPEAPVVVQPHKDSSTKAIVAVFDAARMVGANVSLASGP